jgi:hypothetical protein
MLSCYGRRSETSARQNLRTHERCISLSVKREVSRSTEDVYHQAMGRGVSTIGASGATLLYGRTRSGTRSIRLSAVEQAAQALQAEITAYQQLGGKVYADDFGNRLWQLNGEYHRDNGPAVERTDNQIWFQHGVKHRDGGPAEITEVYGQHVEVWYQHGQIHRQDGPARVKHAVVSEWFRWGQLHREDGPARIGADGAETFCLDDVEYSRDDWQAELDLRRRLL